MASADFTWPRKTREFHNHHFDSTVWNDFRFRDDDIIVASYAKSGTTWMQQIIAQLLFNGAPDLDVAEMSPWVDMRIPSKDVKLAAIEAQTHRRFLKTHLPVDALVFSPKAKYIYVARDGRDVVWSLYNHHASANARYYQTLNDTPGRVGPPIEPPPTSIRQYYHDWLDKDGHPYWPFWENIGSWWDIRHLPNVALFHFAKLKEDLPGQIRRVAAYLEIPIDESKWELILDHCSFEFMKRHATKSVPLGGAFWDGGSQTFFHRGKNGRWREVLSREESEKYEKMAREKLGEACAYWLETGELPDREPAKKPSFSSTSLTIRKETRNDVKAIRRLLEGAFGRCSEANLVDALRDSGALLFSLVAVENGEIVGHIGFSTVAIRSESATFDAVALVPVAVIPALQHRGIGSALVRAGLDACRRAGRHVVVVLGDPEFYSRFGFATSAAYGIRCPFEVPEAAFMVAELVPGALGGLTGKVSYGPEFKTVST